MTMIVKRVDAKIPKIIAQAKPEKTGSNVITQLASNVVPAVSRIGRVRIATERMIDSFKLIPSATAI